MKVKSSLASVLSISTAVLLTASPAFAASAGRISGGSFRSSPSYSRPSYRSSPSSSYTFSAPQNVPSRPSTNYGYVPAPRIPYNPPSRSSTNVIILPDLTPSPRPVITDSHSSTLTTSTAPQQPANPALLFWLLGILGVVGITAFLLFGGWDDFVGPWLTNQKEKYRKLTIVRQRVALLASAKDIQSDLIKLAERGDTVSSRGLTKILQETSLTLLRHPDKVAYAWSDKYRAASEDAENLYNQLSMEGRSKTSEETLTNVSGRILDRQPKDHKETGHNEYILVDILAVTNSNLTLNSSDSQENLKSNLVTLGAVSPEELIALEIIWQPEDEYDVLSKEELLSLYPELNVL